MQPYHLIEPRNELIKHVAKKAKNHITTTYNSIFDYLCHNYLVVVNELAPEFIYIDDDNGFIVSVNNSDDESALMALAELKLFHYMIENDVPQKELLSQEVSLFMRYYKSCPDAQFNPIMSS